MLAANVLPGVWHTDPWSLPYAPADASFVVGEIESSDDYDGVVFALPHLDPAVPAGIITNFNGLLVNNADGSLNQAATRERCAPLVEAGLDVQTEFYLSGLQPGSTPASLEFVARTHCGFTSQVAPVFGVFEGYGLSNYESFMSTRGWGVYLAEYLA